MAQVTTNDNSDITTNSANEILNRQKISKIKEAKKLQSPIVNNLIKSINKKTNRVETGLLASKGEFVYRKNGKTVKEGTAYHIHYTTDLKIFYMTRFQHSGILSELIRKVSNFNTVETYNTLNPQQSMILKPTIVIPDIEDYKKEFIKRFFAKKSNEKSGIFEISEDDFQTSPLYDYAELNWFIKGKRELVRETNIISVNLSEGEYSFKGLKKILPDFQYYREEGLDKKENLLKRLGQIPTTEQTTSTSQTETRIEQPKSNNKATGYGAASGPPTGTTTVSSGGSSY
tara:strand:- start:9280 stop:10140 length:861 start_codon:yes stop_codon:yes gene_type:complete